MNAEGRPEDRPTEALESVAAAADNAPVTIPKRTPRRVRQLLAAAVRLGCDVEISANSRYVIRRSGAIVASVPAHADVGLLRRARRALDRIERDGRDGE